MKLEGNECLLENLNLTPTEDFCGCCLSIIILFPLLADVNNPEWTRHKKHVFVFSEAGKPIYSR